MLARYCQNEWYQAYEPSIQIHQCYCQSNIFVMLYTFFTLAFEVTKLPVNCFFIPE